VLPVGVTQVLTRFLCCEVTTLTREGAPLTWPAVALYLPQRGQLVLSTSIGFPVKALNLRRDPRVSLLFSDATGSGLSDPPHVLVQGRAHVSDNVLTWGGDLTTHWGRVNTLQPMSRHFTRTPMVRWFMGFYYQRLLIHITPDRIRWWPTTDTTETPDEAAHPGHGQPPNADQTTASEQATTADGKTPNVE
jgi:hypothetical protein